jgi:hypothetical protein
MRIAFDPIGVRFDAFDPKFLTVALPARGAWGGEDFKEARSFHDPRLLFRSPQFKKEPPAIPGYSRLVPSADVAAALAMPE